MSEHYKKDTQNEIDMCLSCTKNECVNCLKYMKAPQKYRPGIEERNKRIEEMFLYGMTAADIARAIKIDNSTVCRIIKQRGLR